MSRWNRDTVRVEDTLDVVDLVWKKKNVRDPAVFFLLIMCGIHPSLSPFIKVPPGKFRITAVPARLLGSAGLKRVSLIVCRWVSVAV